MNIPDFAHDNLNPRFVGDGEGDAFQRFVFDALRPEFPQLHLFPTGGKDGGIDLSQTDDSSRLIVETKKVGAEDVATAASREWILVAGRLRKHLADPDGPTKGQSQYRPWYRHDIPVTDYLYCISGKLANENQRDALRGEIEAVFVELAARHAHLTHLSGIAVRVLDWGYFEGILQSHPHLLFRWFPKTRPVGLTPLERQPATQGFRDFLNEDRLPYLSRSAFRRQHGDVVATHVEDESAMLALLNDGQVTGLVLTGSGGVGKTRLAYELGRKAQSEGWTVLVVGARLKAEALVALVERVRPGVPVLLIFDYIETQQNFVETANELTDLKNTYALRLHFVANCRSSYYHVLEGAVEHRRIDLSPPRAAEAHDWTVRYRQAVVRFILQQGVPDFDEQHLELCRDVPVFAVFMCYLVANHRQPWLEELLAEKDFGQWVASRVKRTLRDEGIDRDLALLMCMFPMPRSAVIRLDAAFGKVIECLSTDGWIGPLPDAEATWTTAHDVLADRVVLSYLERVGGTAELFVERLFDVAQEQELLRSCFTTLQRIAEQPAVRGLAWLRIIEARSVSNAEQWRGIRDLLIRTSLLSESDKLDLLESCPDLWLGAETEPEFQNAVGWLARWASRDEHSAQISGKQQATLTSWVTKAATHANLNNFALTSAVIFCPGEVRDTALAWLSTRPRLFQTHYLIVAWLKAGLPSKDVEGAAAEWLARHPLLAHVSFVVGAWLDAAGKDGLELVREPMRAWLPLHSDAFEADHVFRAWLEHDGEFTLIAGAAAKWLRKYRERYEAVYVTKSLARQRTLEESTIRDILFWARTFARDDDALFRTTQLGPHLHRQGIEDDLMVTAESLLKMRGTVIHPPATWLLDTICSYLICARSLGDRGYRDRVNDWFSDWFRHASSFLNPPRPPGQRPQFIERLAECLYGGDLDLVRDRESLRKFLLWVSRWSPENKSRAQAQLEELSVAFPDPTIWGVIDFPITE